MPFHFRVFLYLSLEAEKVYKKGDNPNIFACSKLPAIGFSGILCLVATPPPPKKKLHVTSTILQYIIRKVGSLTFFYLYSGPPKNFPPLSKKGLGMELKQALICQGLLFHFRKQRFLDCLLHYILSMDGTHIYTKYRTVTDSST
jgi:hypothetical protein